MTFGLIAPSIDEFSDITTCVRLAIEQSIGLAIHKRTGERWSARSSGQITVIAAPNPCPLRSYRPRTRRTSHTLLYDRPRHPLLSHLISPK